MRKALGVTAFGVNYFDLPPGAEGLEHNETQTNQEEVYVYVKGSGSAASRRRRDRGAGASPCGSIREVTRQPWRATRVLSGSRSAAPKDGGYEPPLLGLGTGSASLRSILTTMAGRGPSTRDLRMPCDRPRPPYCLRFARLGRRDRNSTGWASAVVSRSARRLRSSSGLPRSLSRRRALESRS